MPDFSFKMHQIQFCPLGQLTAVPRPLIWICGGKGEGQNGLKARKEERKGKQIGEGIGEAEREGEGGKGNRQNFGPILNFYCCAHGQLQVTKE